MLKNLVVTVTTAAALACASMTATAAFTSITVFGDSLSDGGNDFIYTGGNFPPPPYAQRFSNGPDRRRGDGREFRASVDTHRYWAAAISPTAGR